MEEKRTPFSGEQKPKMNRQRRNFFFVLALVVAFVTVSLLVLPALTAENEAHCGFLQHVHTEACYERKLICPLEENEEHTHTEACYQTVLICTLLEHTHTTEDWEKTLPADLPENRGEAVAQIAKSQVGYRESEKNYFVTEDGEKNHYTRYGAWYGDSYGPWSGMFASFCVHYAGISEEEFPYGKDLALWIKKLEEKGYYHAGDAHAASAGDLVFLSLEGDGAPDSVGVLLEKEDGKGETILLALKDQNGTVSEKKYAAGGKEILGYTAIPTGARAEKKEDASPAVRAPRVEVWFDGTLGEGTNVNYYPGATNTHVAVTSGQVTLPTSAGNPSGYILNGWYDVTSGVYYGRDQLGQTVPVTQNTVMYADWVPASDDYRDPSRPLADTADTSSFVKTELFDYNELINLKSGKITSSSISATGHSETWNLDANQNDAFNFVFCQWAYYEANGNRAGRIGYLNGLNDRNVYHSNNPYRLELGIVQSESDDILQTLFTESSTPGVRKVGEGTDLFQFDQATGYYYYDNTKNGASYQASEGRFYVYSDPTYIQSQRLSGSRWVNGSDVSEAFMPLDSEKYVPEKDGGGNFWFGMKNTIDFFLPEAPGTNGGNCNFSTTGDPMEFQFIGDDDIWVFVDGELVLDLGGIHGAVSGTIDFSKGTVTRNGTTIPLPSSIREGEHTLTMYYLERGSSKSNCAIYFNICPRYTLDLTKMDAQTREALDGAEFTLYADPDCTIPAILWDSKASHDAGDAARCTFTVTQGHLNCYGLVPGRTYYLKETCPPAGGYADVSDAVIALTLDSRGNPSVQVMNSSELLDVVSVTRDRETQHVFLTITNQKPEDTRIRVEKVWLDASGVETEGDSAIRLQLYRSTQHLESAGKKMVYISTQYFSENPPEGSNNEEDTLLPGDFRRLLSVDAGSDLIIDLASLAPRAGFYAVMANGRAIAPENAVYGTENCYIGASWGIFPVQSATYTLSDITADQHVMITLIGYPEWESGAISIERNLSASFSEVPHGAPQEDPPVVPYDATPVGSAVTLLPGAGQTWSYEWVDLPLGDETGPYYYYVAEDPLDGYVTTYSGNGAQWGCITVTNREAELGGFPLTIFKRSAQDDLPLSGARFDLYRPAQDGEEGVLLEGVSGRFIKVNRAPITTDSSGKAIFKGLEEGVYYLVETASPTGFLLDGTPHRIELNENGAVTDPGDLMIEGNASSPSVTVKNTPLDVSGDLVVEKNWRKKDAAGNLLPDDPPQSEIRFRLYRRYESKPTGIPVTIRGTHRNDTAGTVLLSGEASPGTTFRFSVYGAWSNGSPDNSEQWTVNCTGGTARKLTETQETPFDWYRAPIYEVTIPEDSTGVVVRVNSWQWYDHYEAEFISGYEPGLSGTGETVEEGVSVGGADTFALNEENGWHLGFSRADLGEIPGVEYTYFVQEVSCPEGYEVFYRSEMSGDGNKLYLIMDNVRIYHEYELPEAGGVGTGRLFILGALMETGILVFYGCATRRRKKGENGPLFRR